MIELAVAACASAAWGASDFAAGLAARRHSVLVVLAASQCTGLVLVALMVLLTGAPMPSRAAAETAALAGGAEAAGFAALYAALARGPMAVVAPLAALGGVIPLVAELVRGAHLGAAALVGCIAALVAVALVSRESGGASGRRVAPGIVLGLLAAAAFGTFFLLLAEAAGEAEAVGSVAVARAAAVGLVLPVLAWQSVRRGQRPGMLPRREVGALLSIGALDIAANLLFAYASSRTVGPLVAVVGSTYPVATVLLAARVLGERLDGSQRFGVLLAVAATALLAL